jgi:hypothetical protein
VDVSARVRRVPRVVAGIAVLFAAAAGLVFSGGSAGAVSGQAGPIAVSVSSGARVSAGESVSITAQAPSGTVIYEVRAHLCLPGPNLRSGFDFGFQGQRCTNVAVGGGDVEKIAAFPNGVASATIPSFTIGAGTAHWIDELGYPGTITCGPGHPCDLAVRIEITRQTVFFTVPLCFDASCAAPNGGGGTTTSTLGQSAPTTVSRGPGSTSPGARPGGASSRGGSHPPGAKGSASPTGGARRGNGSVAGKVAGEGRAGSPLEVPGTVGTTRTVDNRAHVLLAVLAGAVAGGWIVSIFMRGEGWVAFAITRLRRRRSGVVHSRA